MRNLNLINAKFYNKNSVGNTTESFAENREILDHDV